MNKLFEMADYGTHYRTLSNTAAVLGSQSQKEASSDVPDQWKVQNWKERIQKSD